MAAVTATALVALTAISLAYPGQAFADGVTGRRVVGPLASALPARTITPQYAYGTGPSQTVGALKAAAPGAPLVVVVHGGGWAVGDKSWVGGQVRQLNAAGFAVVNVNYTLDSASTGAFPGEVDDVVGATRWAIANAARLNADPRRLVLLGGSAGGHLAASAAEQMNAQAPQTVKTVITLSAPTDLQLLAADADHGTIGSGFQAHVYQALHCSPGTCNSEAELAASPAAHVAGTGAQWLIVQSDADSVMPRDQIDAMYNALVAAHEHVTETILPGTAHSFAYWNKIVGQVEQTIAATTG